MATGVLFRAYNSKITIHDRQIIFELVEKPKRGATDMSESKYR